MHRTTQIFSAIGMAAIITACVAMDGMSTKLSKEFREATKQERSISSNDLEDKKKWGDAQYVHDQQEGGIKMTEWVGLLRQTMDAETQSSRDKQRAILLAEIRENGCLFVLEDLNREYQVLTTAEFDQAANQSGLPPSDISYSAIAGQEWWWKSKQNQDGRTIMKPRSTNQ